MKRILSLLTIEKIMKKNGAKYISRDAKIIMRNYIEDYLNDISRKIIKITKHSKRKIVKEKDTRIILEELN